MGFKRNQAYHYLYNKKFIDYFIYVALYVDDMLLIGKNMDLIKEVKHHLSSKFDMKNIGPTHFILGMEIKRDRPRKKLWLS